MKQPFAEPMSVHPNGCIELIMQKSDNDCGIACLAMLLGVSYADVRQAAPRTFTEKSAGLTTQQILRIARKLGHTLRLSKDFTGHDIGIIDLDRAVKDGPCHVAMFLKGTIYTSASGLLYTDVDAYLTTHKFTVLGLIRRDS